MIEIVKDHIYLDDTEDNTEKYGLIGVEPNLTYEPDKSQDYNLYNDYDIPTKLSFTGERWFELQFQSLADEFRVISHLINFGWKRYIVDASQITESNNDKFVYLSTKERLGKNDLFAVGEVSIWIIVPKKKLQKFREDLKNIPNYKIYWGTNHCSHSNIDRAIPYKDKYLIK